MTPGDSVVPRAPGPDAESGRGLQLVEMLSDGYGVTHTQEGKTVWFTLAALATADRTMSSNVFFGASIAHPVHP
ncbi:hypothetical protein GCM10010377_77760 [Streptomyces viridiviolaceus]|nr:hypothetical protein GCM10010377_77760 [Streptomyces viridiviolaceus]